METEASGFFSNPLLVAILPVLLSPIVAWAVSRSGITKQVAAIDYLNKRLDILERLNKLHAELKEAPIRPFLDTEIEHCRAFLSQPVTFIARDAGMAVEATGARAIEITAPGATVELRSPKAITPQSPWARFFLTQPSASMRKRIFKGLFYFFFGVSLFGGTLLVLAILFSTKSTNASAKDLGVLVGVFAGYFGVSLLFRFGAR